MVFLGLLSAFHLHSDYGWLRSSPRALIWSEQWWVSQCHQSAGMLVLAVTQGSGVPLILAAPQRWTDLFVHL